MKKFFVLLFGLIILILIGGCQNLGDLFPFLNRAPIIISEPITTATEDNPYSYRVEAIDPEGDILTYSFTLKPEGMSINSENGLITWMPNNSQVGIHKVIVEISDGKQSITQSFEIEVVNVNNPPQILSYFPTNLNIEINEGDSVKFEVQAKDVDLNTTLYYRWFLEEKLISNSSATGNNSKSSWKYYSKYGDYGTKTVKVLISDGKLEENIQWKVTVNDITPPGDPTLYSVTSPTNISPQTLSGTKEVNSSILINGTEVISLNSSTDWSYSYNLSEGNNNISITSRDAAGNESSSVSTTIVLDTSTPEAPTLNNVVSLTNISPQTLSGTKEANTSIWINGVEAVPLDSSTDWSYSFDLTEGENNISITSRDTVGNESSPVTAVIEYDLNIYVDAGNTSGIEDGTKTHPFNTIAEGIDVVAPGKSVIVSAGTYNEQLVVNKGITLQGAGKESTFINGVGYTGNLVKLYADNITIFGFTIDGGNSTIVGIYLNGCSFININNSLIKNNSDYGISYSNSAPTIEDNNIEINAYSGIEVGSGGSGIIRNNSIISNQYGIRTCSDSSPEISNNDISNNSNTGIYCWESATPVISYNTISNNANCGILIDNILGDSVNPDIGGGEGGSAGKNNITGNQTHGVSNKTSHNIMAKNNWWGDTAGPKYPENTNNAALVSDWAYWDNVNNEDGAIIFDPYLTEPQTYK